MGGAPSAAAEPQRFDGPFRLYRGADCAGSAGARIGLRTERYVLHRRDGRAATSTSSRKRKPGPQAPRVYVKHRRRARRSGAVTFDATPSTPALSTAIWRSPTYPKRSAAPGSPERIPASVRPLNQGHHITTSLAVRRRTPVRGVSILLYNACTETDPTVASIQELSLSGAGMHPKAIRIRNPIALAVNPATGTLWAGVAGQDELGQGHPYAELFDAITLRPGTADYYWPHCYDDRKPAKDGDICTAHRCRGSSSPPTTPRSALFSIRLMPPRRARLSAAVSRGRVRYAPRLLARAAGASAGCVRSDARRRSPHAGQLERRRQRNGPSFSAVSKTGSGSGPDVRPALPSVLKGVFSWRTIKPARSTGCARHERVLQAHLQLIPQSRRSLSLQHVLSVPPEHDELLFIIVHQVHELWFKQMLHEIEAAMRHLAAGDLLKVQKNFRRIHAIQRLLEQQVDVLETMTPQDFNGFRDRLDPASGFQSAQFREIEFVCGSRKTGYLQYLEPTGAERARFKERLTEPTLYDALKALLAARGFAVATPDELLESFKAIYQRSEELYALYLLLEDFIEFDERFLLWRGRHVRMVERMIGMKRGTGGSLGVPYLERTLEKKFFPELWEVRRILGDPAH